MSRIADALTKAQLGAGPTLEAELIDKAIEEDLRSFTRNDIDPRPAATRPSRVGTRERVAVPNAPVFNGFAATTSERLVTSAGFPGPVAERFRTLAATLHHAQAERGIKVVVVASALPGEGKTLTATNIALTLSESFKRRVLLIDADVRRPTMHELLQVPNAWGLSDGLRAADDNKFPLTQVSPYLSVLLGGRPDPDPVGGLSSERMRRVITDAAETFDWVIIDTPPAALLPDADLICRHAHGALLVVRAGVTPFPAIQRAIESLGQDRILGVLLNGAEIQDSHDYSAYTGAADRYVTNVDGPTV